MLKNTLSIVILFFGLYALAMDETKSAELQSTTEAIDLVNAVKETFYKDINIENALAQCQKSSFVATPDVQNLMGVLYFCKSRFCNNAPEAEQALVHLLAAANEGHHKAMYNLGEVYKCKTWHVPADEKQAIKDQSARWYLLAARNNDADALIALAEVCLSINSAIDTHEKAAAENYKKAADLGHPVAQYKLAILYFDMRRSYCKETQAEYTDAIIELLEKSSKTVPKAATFQALARTYEDKMRLTDDAGTIEYYATEAKKCREKSKSLKAEEVIKNALASKDQLIYLLGDTYDPIMKI